MEAKNRVGSTELTAEPFHVDFTGHLTMGVLGNHLLNCAGVHASSRGFGISELNTNHYTWVLSRIAIELDEMPYQYDRFTIDTWVEDVYRLFTNRNFRISKEDKPIGYARSIWAMIDLNTRQPADVLQLHGGNITNYITDEIECPIEKPGRIRVRQEHPVDKVVARYSDIDINGHVNSMRYIEHMMDQFGLDYLEKHSIKRFEVAYSAEAYFGDTLNIFMEPTAEHTFEFELRKDDGTACVKSKLIFNDK
ncbi:MAG: acyl-[acyl-carrier-protein] thioesterase [Bacteroidaceae bacterium]|nr:acyl-[acyl-carrier-protein] thioesterase [Bacteroidaceae bacterium]